MNRFKFFSKLIFKVFNIHELKFILYSIKSFIIIFFKEKNPFQIVKKRPNGISVLLPTQNEELIVKISIMSFLDFADEIIVVDNGSIDDTKYIIKELAKKYPKIRFFDRPELIDLHQNRQFALRRSKYRWICRFDSDFVAYTDGYNNIHELREYLLKLPRRIIPKAIKLHFVNIGGDFWHVMKYYFEPKYKLKVFFGPRMSIYEYFPFLTFSRFERREYGTFQNLMNSIEIKTIHIMHCMVKSKLNSFLRSERTNWRYKGDYKKYPTLISYIKDVIIEKYNTNSVKEAIKRYSKEFMFNKDIYIKYNPEKYLPYPTLIKEEMKKKDVFRINKYSDE